MRQRDFPLCQAASLGDLRGIATEFDDRLTAWKRNDFDVAPRDAARQAGAKSFHHRLLTREASGEVLGAIAAAFAVGNFASREYTIEESRGMLLEQLLDAGNVFDI